MKVPTLRGRMDSASKESLEAARDKLNDKQLKLVHNLMVPGTTQKDAAIMAGYAEGSAHVTAHRVLQSEPVKAYIETLMQDGFKINAMQCLEQMSTLARTANSELVKYNANADLLDRAGYKAQDKQGVGAQGVINVSIDLSGK